LDTRQLEAGEIPFRKYYVLILMPIDPMNMGYVLRSLFVILFSTAFDFY